MNSEVLSPSPASTSSTMRVEGDTVSIPDFTKSSRALGQRNDTIELLRIIAACGVIWFHMENAPFKNVAYAGLVFFLIVSCFFQTKQAFSTNKADFRKRASRLLIPWMAWFLIYAFFNLAKGKPLLPASSNFISAILSGPWIGLWYLPFCFFSAFVILAVVRPLLHLKRLQRYLTCLAAALITYLLVAETRASVSISAPWAQWLHAAPSLFIGIALACALEEPDNRKWMVLLLQTFLLAAWSLTLKVDSGLAICYAVGSIMVTMALLFPSRMPNWVGRGAALTFGVYLVHPMVFRIMKLLPGLSGHFLVCFLFTTFTSFSLISFFKRLPVLRRIV